MRRTAFVAVQVRVSVSEEETFAIAQGDTIYATYRTPADGIDRPGDIIKIIWSSSLASLSHLALGKG